MASVWFLSYLSFRPLVVGRRDKKGCLLKLADFISASLSNCHTLKFKGWLMITTSCFMKRTSPTKLSSNKLQFFVYRDSWELAANSACNGICTKANTLLCFPQDSVCGCREVLGARGGVLTSNTVLTKDETLTERSFFPWNPNIISNWRVLSSWQEKVHRLPSPLGKFKMFIHEFSFTSL